MLHSLLIAVTLLVNSVNEPEPEPYRLDQIYDAFQFTGIQVSYHWEDCGEFNAWYSPDKETVILCNELKPFGRGVVRFALAHELSHAVIHQLHIPFTGSEEEAADELAAVILNVHDWQADVVMMAEFWLELEGEVRPWDPHPPHDRRAYTLYCLAESSQAKPHTFCNEHGWLRALESWVALLKV